MSRAILTRPVPHHPECTVGVIGTVYGPPERRDRIIITNTNGHWCWHYKQAGWVRYINIGPVSRIPATKVLEATITAPRGY